MTNTFMERNLKGKDFLTLADFTKKDLLSILELSTSLKKDSKKGIFLKLLENKILATFFLMPSFRTMLSSEVAMNQLGGKLIKLNQNEIQLNEREELTDIANILSSFVNAMFLRVYSHDTLEKFSNNSTIPIFNALSDKYHPCQVIADLLTLQEIYGKLEGLNITYVGDSNNVSNSLMIACKIIGININIATPKEFVPKQEILEQVNNIKNDQSKIEVFSDIYKASENADIIYTDVWTSMDQKYQEEERENFFLDYQVNKKLLDSTKKDTKVMHCLPAYKGKEISTSTFDENHKLIYRQAENRLHSVKAIFSAILSDK